MVGSRDRAMRLTLPVRVLAQRFAFGILVIGAFALMLLGKADSGLTERLRFVVNDALAPVMGVLSQPIASVNRGIAAVDDFLYVHSENARLRQENERLLQWQNAARQLEQQNAAFRSLLNAKVDPRLTFVSARVIVDVGGPFVRTLIVNAGGRDGVTKGQAAISDHGLVGHVVETGERAARLLLLTDLNSRIPVVVESTRARSILAGNNTDRPELQFLADSAPLQVGERIVTSGHGGVFPGGIPIGVVTQVSQRGAEVELFANFNRLEYVRILRYQAPRLYGDDGAAGSAGGAAR
ncbi:MAG: rod shape-determining protein MreC [Proteobacteria bacterium]|nr:rod shape-determining protein MreC [Pseudomonadota bacterium]